MAPILKSYEGVVGRKYPEHNVFVTTPNMDSIPDLLLGTQTVRLHTQCHYGKHDPLLSPQPFNSNVPHLALIRWPSSATSRGTSIPWKFISDKDFEPIPGHNLAATPIGHFPRNDLNQLREYFVGIDTASQSSDQRVRSSVAQFHYLIAHLEQPATYSEAIAAWRLAQRICLELEARMLWLNTVQPIFTQPLAWKTQPILPVVGAVTDRVDIAEFCFRSGIPIWLYRSMDLLSSSETTPKVVQWTLELSDGLRKMFDFISFDEMDPPSPVIFKGPAASTERYQCMAVFSWKTAFPASIFGQDSAVADAHYDKLAAGVSRAVAKHHPNSEVNVEPSIGPSRTRTRALAKSTQSSTSRQPPYPMRTPKPKQLDRNKFFEVKSLLLPQALANWKSASEEYGGSFDQNQRSRPGVPRNYPLPEPAVVASNDPVIAQSYMFTYLKLRPLLLYRLRTFGAITCMQKPSEWRQLLGLELHKVRSDSRSAVSRQNLVEKMRNSRDMSNLDLDFSKLPEIVPTWRGAPAPNPMPPAFFREVMADLYDISFKTEFLLADRYLYESKESKGSMDKDGEAREGDEPLTREARQVEVFQLFPNLLDGQELGLAPHNQNVRQKALYGMFKVMCGWTAMPAIHPTVKEQAERLSGPHLASSTDIEEVDFQLGWHYIATFADFFKRAPVLPHYT